MAPGGPLEVQQLARPHNDLAQQRDELLDDVDAQIARPRPRWKRKEPPAGAYVGTGPGGRRLVIRWPHPVSTTTAPVLQFKALPRGRRRWLAGADRPWASIFSILEKSQVTHAQEVIRQRLANGKSAMSISSPPPGGGPSACGSRWCLVQAAAAAEGRRGRSPATCSRSKTSPAASSRRPAGTRCCIPLTEGSRASLGSLRAAVTNLIDYPDMEPNYGSASSGWWMRRRGMSQRLDQTMAEFPIPSRPAGPGGRPRHRYRCRRPAPHRGQAATAEQDRGMNDALWIKADSFSWFSPSSWRPACRNITKSASCALPQRRTGAYLDPHLERPGHVVGNLYTWEMEPMHLAGETTPLSAARRGRPPRRRVWYQREKAAHRAFFRFSSCRSRRRRSKPSTGRRQGPGQGPP